MKRVKWSLIVLIFIQLNGFSQSCLPDGIYINTQSEIDNFQIDYPGCKRIEGDVKIADIYITDLSGFSEITSFGGDLDLAMVHSLTSLSGLENVISIDGWLQIFGKSITNLEGLKNLETVGAFTYTGGSNNFITRLEGLDKLKTINGGLSILLTSLNNFEGLKSIESIGSLGIRSSSLVDFTGLESINNVGNIYIRNASLESLNGLHNITTIGGDFHLENTNLADFLGLENVLEIKGYFKSIDNDIINFSGLENLKTIDGDFKILRNDGLLTFSGLESLSEINGSLTMSDLDNLLSLSGINKLVYVGGDFILSYCRNIENLDEIVNLRIIDGGIELNDNNRLKNIMGFKNLDVNELNSISIEDNDSLSDCHANSICEYISNPYAEVDIRYNSTGCDNYGEIKDKCDGTGIIDNSKNQVFKIFPNPINNEITIFSNHEVEIDHLDIYNQFGQIVLSEKNSFYEINVSKLPKGLYIIQISTKEFETRNRLIKM